MTSSTSTIDYRNTIFQYPTLTKIHGEPTAEAILKLIKELKANARSVYSDLVGGRHGHLFLVLTPEQFASISSTPFVRPEHPGSLNLPPHATQAVIRELKDIRNDKLRLFKEVNAVEATLIQQINTAIDGDYLQAIRNRISNTLEGPVYNIIKHLLTNYGKITAQMLANKEDELRQLTYDPNLPMDFLFSKIDDLSEFANQAGTPYTDIQRMQKAYLLIQRTARFNQHITEWNRLPPEQRNTWDLFKKFFRKAHQEYREVTNLTLRDFGENHSAYLVQEVVNAVTERVSESLESANAIRDTIPQMMHEIQQLKLRCSKSSLRMSLHHNRTSSLRILNSHLRNLPSPQPTKMCRPTKAAIQTVRSKIMYRTPTRDDVEKSLGNFIAGLMASLTIPAIVA